MVKKMVKYSKFILCIALILSLVAPSYAALSASDGSAFVTKAEFDSALADFNSRLTTFEAGINSKIDSQVTSYLDRNGIWNGKKQTITPECENGVFLDLVDGLDYTTTMPNIWANTYGTTYTSSSRSAFKLEGDAATQMWKLANEPDYAVKEFVPQINKSGLLYMKLLIRLDFSASQAAITSGNDWYCDNADQWSYKWHNVPLADRNINSNSLINTTGSISGNHLALAALTKDHAIGYHTSTVEISAQWVLNSSIVKWSYCVYSGTSLFQPPNIAQWVCPAWGLSSAPIITTALFFVEKDDKMDLRGAISVGGRNTDKNIAIVKKGDGSPLGMFVMVEDLTVY